MNLAGGISFGTNISTSLQKFVATPNQTYRAAILHFVNASQALEPIIRANRTHFHQVPEGQQGLGGFICHSTEDSVATCCKNTMLFQDPLYKIAIPILLYPTNFQGDLLAGSPELQILLIYERGWAKLNGINKTYPLMSNDFTISGKKQGKGVALDFMPAGPAHWQTDQTIFGQFLNKAKMIVEGPGLLELDKMLGKTVTALDIENAVRSAAGLPPSLPAPPSIPPVPMMAMGLPAAALQAPALPTVAAAVPLAPSPMAVPLSPAPVVAAVAAPPVAPTGPASPAQISAITGMLSLPAAETDAP